MTYIFKKSIGALLLILVSLLMSCSEKNKNDIVLQDPLINGDFADPSIVEHNGKYYIYATIDPWGAEELGVLESDDFVHWEQKHINWPTKELCTSETSNSSNVWAPSVIEGKDGKFYMYVSVGSEVWAGVSEHPLGPWKNAKSDNSPLIKGNMFPEYHMIDAEVFIDDDKQVYLYWGSGLNWVNGHCFVVPLKDDMISFDEAEIKDITPPNYFEAPFMVKKGGTYFLMYSDGKCTTETYKVRYAKANNPFGPFSEGENSPVLTTSKDRSTLGPGHHSIFTEGGQDYILYHRITNNNDQLYRELAIDSLNFSKGEIEVVKPLKTMMHLNEN
ncbi:Glycosyl hydrolases family 43 [Zunongwangia mangrovi]|uniref:Glycosyl hydrolases family 43 n=1 Tax=Zunongwangia mangrovi TaxID=1334022 RepID=A0A1I1HLT1_9FLAO|nr:family 43 glycosylhydrolase [Zunongwangia mangrovi]SFC22040.1 Glycosyl hydrolases family 43 [Zunongwangia mangrovi]